MIDCSGLPDEANCQYECEMTLGAGNEKFEALLQVHLDILINLNVGFPMGL